MRKYLHIDLARRAVRIAELHGEDIAKAGRYLIAKTLLSDGIARVDPWSPENPLIFSAGPFAGIGFSNGGRISVGCKSPLTGGVKEANSGGTFGTALGHLSIAGLTLHGISDDWLVIRIMRDGSITFDSAEPLMGKGNNEAAALIREIYGKRTSFSLCGPVGEYRGIVAGVAFSDMEGRPGRLAARGGVGAVMGNKKVKAIVADLDKMPELHDKKKAFENIRSYAGKIGEQEAIKTLRDLGTAFVADLFNYTGGLPVRNFSSGRLVEPGGEPLKVGGDFIRQQNMERGGKTAHACMGGCAIQCGNVYVESGGKEVVSPLDYENIVMLGTNLGLTEPDEIARLNAIANDLGVDTIETGATIAILMDAGYGRFGDIGFIVEALEDIRHGTERGRILARGAESVGLHYGIRRVPVIKHQAISAHDPRIVEVTGISMMTTPQGADHTTGNVPGADCKGKTLKELAAVSFNSQVNTAVADSLGLCAFGRSVTDANHELLAETINSVHGTELEPSAIRRLGVDALLMEREFNRAVGFTPEDDGLPAFFYEESLAPTDRRARFSGKEVSESLAELFAAEQSAGT
ncbi:MAG: aldehyde ferredoxin oxidoreductase [Betaproteobacteria bacterium]|nr:aldehyde ferredoxin oxidoreductase [Betaproteobacteria bacterium]